MNPESNDKVSKRPINETELEATTNAAFDAFTQSARDMYKNVRKLSENLDDHATIIMTDIFGPNVAREHSRRLEQEAGREAAANHPKAADHYKRRDLNFSRNTLGEFDTYTVDLNKKLNGDPVEEGLKLVDQISANFRRNQELMKELYAERDAEEAANVAKSGAKNGYAATTIEAPYPQQTMSALGTNQSTLSQF